jgi:hypothetical protein
MVQSAKTPHGGVAWPSIPPDPVGSGLVASIARPGGNTTGFTNFEPSLTGKWLELLKEIAPGIVRVAVIFNPKTAPGEGPFFLGPFEAVARSFAVEPIAARVTDAAQIESALAAIWREPGGGLIVMPDAFTTIHRKAPAGLSLKGRGAHAIRALGWYPLHADFSSFSVHICGIRRWLHAGMFAHATMSRRTRIE